MAAKAKKKQERKGLFLDFWKKFYFVEILFLFFCISINKARAIAKNPNAKIAINTKSKRKSIIIIIAFFLKKII